MALMALPRSWGSRNRFYAHLSHNPSSIDSDAKTVAIVGGGMAGASAAQELLLGKQLPLKVTMFDAGKAPGGRMCSKTMYDSAIIDHGCQFISPRSSTFLSAVREWESTGKVRKCEDLRVATATSGASKAAVSTADDYIGVTEVPMPIDCTYTGIPHMGALVVNLLSELDTLNFQLASGTVVDHMRWDEEGRAWSLFERSRDDKGNHYRLLGTYDAVILAEGASMFRHNRMAVSLLPEPVRGMIAGVTSTVRYIPAFTFIAFLEKGIRDRVSLDAINIEPSASVNYSSSGKSEQPSGLSAFRFICNATAKLYKHENSQKKQEIWIAVTSPSKSNQILSEWPMRDDQGNLVPQDARYRGEIADHLLKDFSVAMEHIANQLSEKPFDIIIKHQQVQRWGSAFPENTIQLPCLVSHDYSMAICGDCFTGLSPHMTKRDASRDEDVTPVESSWLSGVAAARSIF